MTYSKILSGLAIALFLLVDLSAQAAYPVTAVVQTLPPFTPSLADWADPVNTHLGATLLLNDRQEPGYQVQLELTIEGSGITVRTNRSWVPRPLSLSFGVPLQLTGSELGEYLQVDHLDFMGYSRQAYLENGGLPPGSYSVCIRVLDYGRATEESASADACSFIQVQRLQPPVILSPTQGQFIVPFTPQNLIINWSPRHTGIPLTRYRVELYEVAPGDNRTPENIINLTSPYPFVEVEGLLSTVINETYLPMKSGSDYLLRVQAIDPDGLRAFVNDGWSEIVRFSYGGDCSAPGGLEASINSFDAASISWTPQAGIEQYNIRLREQSPQANWYNYSVIGNYKDVVDLEASTTYEVAVQSVCGENLAGEFSSVYQFTTDDEPSGTVDCGSSIGDIPLPGNTNNIALLKARDTVEIAGGFKMKITSAKPSAKGGGWDGTGQIRVPWLFKTFNFYFVNLFVNTDKVVYDGNAVGVDEGLSSLPGFKTVAEILAVRDTLPLNFCGDSTSTIDPPGTVPYSNDDFYASGSEAYTTHYIPYNPRATSNTTVNDSMFYNQYNPKNDRRPYSATDYTNPRNPYTEDKPYQPYSIWNPWNEMNSYDYLDYGDPANPWTPQNPWTAERMLDKSGFDISLIAPHLLRGAVKLPVKLGSGENMVAVHNMKFTPRGAFMSVYFSGNIPMAKQFMAFKAVGIGFGPNGLQGEVKMSTLAPVKFSWKNVMQLTIKDKGKTYIKFDCNGLNEISLDVGVEICPEVAVAVDPYTYVADTNSYVTADFRIVAATWGDFSATADITPFELRKLPGWAFTIDKMVIDLSDTYTDGAVTFPSGYNYGGQAISGPGNFHPTWRGFYLRQGRIRIPDNITGRKDGQPSVTIGAQNLIIDQTGFTGTAYVKNLIALDTGRLDSWAIAIDTLALQIQQNQFKSTHFAGVVKVPAIKQALTYDCHIQPGSLYSFELGLTDTVTIDALVAKARLDPNSTVGIEYRPDEDRFSAYATLHGKISFGPSMGGGGENDTGGNAATGGAAAASGQTPDTGPAADDGKNKMVLPSITFINFSISSRKPYISEVGTWSVDTKNGTAANFPLVLHGVGMFQNEEQNEVAFGIDLSVNLVPATDNLFSARGKGFIICNVLFNEETERQEWSFKRVRLDRLQIGYEGAGFAFKGYIQNYEEHPEYGTGFQGGLMAGFTPGLTISVSAMFGKKDDFRYFFADAMVALDPGIVIGATGVAFYGFGGGVSYHMDRVGMTGLALPEEPTDDPPPASLDEVALGEPVDLASTYTMTDPTLAVPGLPDFPSALGVSQSGVKYTPDKVVGIGIKATVAFGAARREVFNGDITFEISFNSGGGIRRVGLSGNANVMTPPKSKQASLSFYADIQYNFEAETLDAAMRLQVMYPPLISYIRGSYPNAVAGTGYIHGGPDGWWFHLGTPTTPISLSLDVSKLTNLVKDDGTNDPQQPVATTPLDSNSIKKPLMSIEAVGLILTAYIDFGSTNIPPFPPLDSEVSSIINDPKFEQVGRDDGAFADNGGILFGAALRLNIPKLNFFIFYAEFGAGAGFDVMLKDYGTEARCLNDLDNDNPIGFNGWYATGQIWGYLRGSVGVDIKLGALKIKLKVFDVAAAAVLQARLPNPMWAQGAVAGRINVLNGLIKGDVSFEFELGQVCEIVPTGTQEVLIIQSLTPADSTEEASVFIQPQAIFNLPIDVATPLLDENDEYVYLKPQLKYFRLYDTETNEEVNGSVIWDESKTVAAFKSTDILLGNHEYRMEVKVEVWQRPDEQNYFELVNSDGNIPPEQIETSLFTTGLAPDHIPEDNVVYAYPVYGQTAFFKDESSNGYVQLDRGQPELFRDAGQDFERRIVFRQNNAVVSSASLSYDANVRRVNFTIPSGNLQPSTISSFEIVSIPTDGPQDVTANVEDILVEMDTGVNPDSNDTQLLLATQETNGALEAKVEKVIYHLDFRTSQYATFTAKVAALAETATFVEIVTLTSSQNAQGDQVPYLSMDDFGALMTPGEAFDQYELKGLNAGVKDIDPLVRAEANLDVMHQNWYNTVPRPMTYDRFPKPEAPYDITLDWRDPLPYGLPPMQAVNLETEPENAVLPDLAPQGNFSGQYYPAAQQVKLLYKMPAVIYKDYADFKQQVWLFVGDNPDMETEFADLIDWQFQKAPRGGTYNVVLKYILPGETMPNSSYQYQLRYN